MLPLQKLHTPSQEKQASHPGLSVQKGKAKLGREIDETRFTSNVVPFNIMHSSSVHIVGSGTYSGNSLTYSVHGLDTPTICFWFVEPIVTCISKNSRISCLKDYCQILGSFAVSRSDTQRVFWVLRLGIVKEHSLCRQQHPATHENGHRLSHAHLLTADIIPVHSESSLKLVCQTSLPQMTELYQRRYHDQ